MTGPTVAVVAGERWRDHVAGSNLAGDLHNRGWGGHLLLHRGAVAVETVMAGAWSRHGGRTELVDDPAAKCGQPDGPDLLIIFAADRGDDAHRAALAAEQAGWPPVLVHALPGAYPRPPQP